MKTNNVLSVCKWLFTLMVVLSVSGCKKDNDTKEEKGIPSPVFNSELTYGSMTDQQGNIYKTIDIGLYTWMAENLRTTIYADGTAIPHIENFREWGNIIIPGYETPAYCWFESDSGKYSAVYGAIYNGYVLGTGKLCPVGWHVPTYKEWTNLIECCGGNRYAGRRLKETGTSHWVYNNSESSNSSGFTALPGGIRNDLAFLNMGDLGFWWGTPENDTLDNRWILNIEARFNIVQLYPALNCNGLSVRLVKDAETSIPE